MALQFTPSHSGGILRLGSFASPLTADEQRQLRLTRELVDPPAGVWGARHIHVGAVLRFARALERALRLVKSRRWFAHHAFALMRIVSLHQTTV